jgi:hypothetical protein
MKLKLVLKVLPISQDMSIVSNFHSQRHRKSRAENLWTLTNIKKQMTLVYHRRVIISENFQKIIFVGKVYSP